MDIEDKKKMAALAALDRIQDGMIIGLGTGTTVQYMLEGLATRIKNEHLDITGISTSDRTTNAANSALPKCCTGCATRSRRASPIFKISRTAMVVLPSRPHLKLTATMGVPGRPW